MNNTTYDTKPDSYFDHIREDIVSMIDFSATTILDVGCGTGATSLRMKTVLNAESATGIELPGPAADVAEKSLDRVIKDSVEKLHQDSFRQGEFDLVVCADVLEHLIDPTSTLTNIRKWLNDEGHLIVSVPNMGHITVIIKLIMDRLEYEDEGILDRTHLKFFTLHTIRQMLETSGFDILRVETNRSKTLKFKILDFFTRPIGSRLSIYQYRLVAKPNIRDRRMVPGEL